jgi:transcriptional regulator with PAS, ATPase and Fis domain
LKVISFLPDIACIALVHRTAGVSFLQLLGSPSFGNDTEQRGRDQTKSAAQQAGANKSQVASALGITRKTLCFWLKN